MSKAAHIVDRLLEADPDQVDPKGALMSVPLEMKHWLERNDFVYDDTWECYEKNTEPMGCTVHLPRGNPDESDGWIVDFDTELHSHLHLAPDEVKKILIKSGLAQP